MTTTEKQTEHRLGGGWGDAINWFNPEEFAKNQPDEHEFSVVGWKHEKPKVGDTLKGEFVKSTCWFRFVKVEPCDAPLDMFSAKVVLLRQEMKRPTPPERTP